MGESSRPMIGVSHRYQTQGTKPLNSCTQNRIKDP